MNKIILKKQFLTYKNNLMIYSWQLILSIIHFFYVMKVIKFDHQAILSKFSIKKFVLINKLLKIHT